MSEREGLDAQIAQRLFGWTWGRCSPRCWYTQDGFHTADGAHVWRLPAYSTDPTATALVWQGVEGLTRVREIYFGYDLTSKTRAVGCDIVYSGRKKTDRWDCARGKGPTWPEALCRAALALAKGLDTGEGEHHA